MDGVNKAILVGNLGADPELRFTQNNSAVLKFRIATSESWKDKDSGERKELTTWHNVVLWGPRAEGLSKILVKGSRIYVEGRIENRSYQDKEGVEKWITEVNASHGNVVLCGGTRPDDARGSGGHERDGGDRKAAGARPANTGGKPPAGKGGGRDFDFPPSGDEIPY